MFPTAVSNGLMKRYALAALLLSRASADGPARALLRRGPATDPRAPSAPDGVAAGASGEEVPVAGEDGPDAVGRHRRLKRYWNDNGWPGWVSFPLSGKRTGALLKIVQSDTQPIGLRECTGYCTPTDYRRNVDVEYCKTRCEEYDGGCKYFTFAKTGDSEHCGDNPCCILQSNRPLMDRDPLQGYDSLAVGQYYHDVQADLWYNGWIDMTLKDQGGPHVEGTRNWDDYETYIWPQATGWSKNENKYFPDHESWITRGEDVHYPMRRPGHLVPPLGTLVHTDVTVGHCKTKCVEDPYCTSFDWAKTEEARDLHCDGQPCCILTRAGPSTGELVSSTDWDHYTLDEDYWGKCEFDEGEPVGPDQIQRCDVSERRDFSSMFRGDNFNEDISHWMVGRGTNFREMFKDNANFRQNLAGWTIPYLEPLDPLNDRWGHVNPSASDPTYDMFSGSGMEHIDFCPCFEQSDGSWLRDCPGLELWDEWHAMVEGTDEKPLGDRNAQGVRYIDVFYQGNDSLPHRECGYSSIGPVQGQNYPQCLKHPIQPMESALRISDISLWRQEFWTVNEREETIKVKICRDDETLKYDGDISAPNEEGVVDSIASFEAGDYIVYQGCGCDGLRNRSYRNQNFPLCTKHLIHDIHPGTGDILRYFVPNDLDLWRTQFPTLDDASPFDVGDNGLMVKICAGDETQKYHGEITDPRLCRSSLNGHQSRLHPIQYTNPWEDTDYVVHQGCGCDGLPNHSYRNGRCPRHYINQMDAGQGWYDLGLTGTFWGWTATYGGYFHPINMEKWANDGISTSENWQTSDPISVKICGGLGRQGVIYEGSIQPPLSPSMLSRVHPPNNDVEIQDFDYIVHQGCACE